VNFQRVPDGSTGKLTDAFARLLFATDATALDSSLLVYL